MAGVAVDIDHSSVWADGEGKGRPPYTAWDQFHRGDETAMVVVLSFLFMVSQGENKYCSHFRFPVNDVAIIFLQGKNICIKCKGKKKREKKIEPA